MSKIVSLVNRRKRKAAASAETKTDLRGVKQGRYWPQDGRGGKGGYTVFNALNAAGESVFQLFVMPPYDNEEIVMRAASAALERLLNIADPKETPDAT